jgi:hypothetical protein
MALPVSNTVKLGAELLFPMKVTDPVVAPAAFGANVAV